MTEGSRIAGALRFAGLGCRIAPAAGKNPGGYLGNIWQRQASRDPDLIRAWWEAWPAANVAILPDRALLPLDVDDPISFERFQLEHGWAPLTPRYLTGGDGGRERLLFAFPGEKALEGVDRKLAEGVQLRHSHKTAMVCIVPPGRNLDTGRELQWTIGLDDAPLAVCPTAWLERAAPPADGRPAGEWVERFCRDYVSGCGETHPSTMSMAAYLVRRLGSGQLALELLLGWNQRRCHPPKPEREIREQVLWAAQREAASRKARQ